MVTVTAPSLTDSGHAGCPGRRPACLPAGLRGGTVGARALPLGLRARRRRRALESRQAGGMGAHRKAAAGFLDHGPHQLSHVRLQGRAGDAAGQGAGDSADDSRPGIADGGSERHACAGAEQGASQRGETALERSCPLARPEQRAGSARPPSWPSRRCPLRFGPCSRESAGPPNVRGPRRSRRRSSTNVRGPSNSANWEGPGRQTGRPR